MRFVVKSTLGRSANETWEAGQTVSAEDVGQDNLERLVAIGVLEAAAEEPRPERKRGGK